MVSIGATCNLYLHLITWCQQSILMAPLFFYNCSSWRAWLQGGNWHNRVTLTSGGSCCSVTVAIHRKWKEQFMINWAAEKHLHSFTGKLFLRFIFDVIGFIIIGLYRADRKWSVGRGIGKGPQARIQTLGKFVSFSVTFRGEEMSPQ